MTKVLRDYQAEDVGLIFEEWKSVRSTLYAAATGLGKTHVMTEVAQRIMPGRTILLAHRNELIDQAAQAFTARGMVVEIEKAERMAGASLFSDCPVVIASVQTLLSGDGESHRMKRFDPKQFDLLLYDECHHGVSTGNKKIVDYFTTGNPTLRVLGVTATPDRADEEALGQIFETVASERDVLWANDNGWLVPPMQRMVHINGLDFSEMRTTCGDLNGADLAAVMEAEGSIQGVVQPTLEHLFNLEPATLSHVPTTQWETFLAGHPILHRAIVFTVSVDQAEMLSNIFNRAYPEIANWVCGKTNKESRAEILKQFREGGKHNILVNVGVATEGYDNPAVDTIVMARPTKSRSLYAQCLDDRTEILTDRGWLGIDSDWTDTKTAAFRLDDSSIRWSQAKRMERPLGDEVIYSISNPHLDIAVTAGHRMVCNKRFGRARTRTSWKFYNASDIPNDAKIPVCGFQHSDGINVSDAELTFIGLVMTDGNINPANGQITLYQSEKYPEIITLIQGALGECGFKFGHHVERRPSNFGERSPLHRWTISRGVPRGRDKHLKGWDYLSPFLDRNMPDSLSEMSRGQLFIFLHALWAGDGSKKKDDKYTPGTWTICCGRKQFVDKLQSLCVRRGFRCNVMARSEKFWILHISDDQSWGLSISASDNRPCWKSDPNHACRRVWCVEVDSGAIVTRRNGKVAVVGNCIGRGTRPQPGIVDSYFTPQARVAAISESKKPHVTVFDFVGNSGRHKLISTADILGGKVSDQAIERAVDKAKQSSVPIMMTQALLDAEEELREEAAKKRAVEESRRARVLAKVSYSTSVVSPFDVFGITPVRARGWERGKTLTEKQRDILLKQGIDPSKMTSSEQKQVLNEIFRRWDKQLCSFKQAKLLQRNGITEKAITRNQASTLIDAMAKNQWKPVAPEMVQSILHPA